MDIVLEFKILFNNTSPDLFKLLFPLNLLLFLPLYKLVLLVRVFTNEVISVSILLSDYIGNDFSSGWPF